MTERVDYELLAALSQRTHPLLNIADDFEAQIRGIPIEWTGEVFQEARNVHHLLDMAQIPQWKGRLNPYDLDARAYLAVMELIELRAARERTTGIEPA